MKLHKALKLRKKIIGEVSNLKQRIAMKNSYNEGALDPIKYNVESMMNQLNGKIDELISIKYAINEANREIQSIIFSLSENKAMISFLKDLNTTEGEQIGGYGTNGAIITYCAQISDEEKQAKINHYQKMVDAMQEEVDVFNYTTEIPWDMYDEPTTVQ
jgi:hypothetical protein